MEEKKEVVPGKVLESNEALELSMSTIPDEMEDSQFTRFFIYDEKVCDIKLNPKHTKDELVMFLVNNMVDKLMRNKIKIKKRTIDHLESKFASIPDIMDGPFEDIILTSRFGSLDYLYDEGQEIQNQYDKMSEEDPPPLAKMARFKLKWAILTLDDQLD